MTNQFLSNGICEHRHQQNCCLICIDGKINVKDIKKRILIEFDKRFTLGETYWKPEEEWKDFGNQTQADELKSFFSKALDQMAEEASVAMILDRETLAELEHQQWERWSKYVYESYIKRGNADAVAFCQETFKRWEKSWKPYNELDEKTKDADRKWADKTIQKAEQKRRLFLSED